MVTGLSGSTLFPSGVLVIIGVVGAEFTTLNSTSTHSEIPPKYHLLVLL